MNYQILLLSILSAGAILPIAAMIEEKPTPSPASYLSLCAAYASRSPEEREPIFKEMQELYPITTAVEQLKTIPSPNVILWFTNYFGSVSPESVTWYKKNVFSRLVGATLWLTDLKAWQILSVGKDQLAKNNPKLLEMLKNRSLDATECPLGGTSRVLTQANLEKTSKEECAYRILSSQSFFTWLSNIKDTTLISDETITALCKTSPREGALSASLSQLGYKPALLNRTLSTDPSKNILDLPNSQVFPVLQYLEGIYYASEIIKNQPFAKTNTVAFVLSNEECSYYNIPGESKPYGTFQKAVQTILKGDAGDTPAVSIQFIPFMYGKTMSAAPFKTKGKRLTSTQLSKELYS